MNNFKNSGPGGLRNRAEYVGGRPSSDADYSTKKKFGGKPAFGGNRGGDRGDRGGRGGQSDRGGRGSFGGNRGGERREVKMFKTTCTACGKAAEVPFRPDGSKPVLCRDCFASNRPDERGNDRGGHDRFSSDRGGRDRKPERDFASPRPDRGPSPDYKALLAQVSTLEAKMNEILAILKTAPTSVAAPVGEVVTEVAEVSTKEKKPKKVAKKVAKKVVDKVTEKKVAKKVVKKAAKKVVKK